VPDYPIFVGDSDCVDVTTANDNDGKRRVRDGYLARWSDANFSEVASDDALLRLAEARNSSANSANRFMLFAAVAAALYLLRLEGVASELPIGNYDLREIPFGLFVFSCVATTLSTLSLIRTGDSRAYDRQLRLACEKKYDSDCDLRYLVFPNEKAWGEPFSRMASVIDAGGFMSVVRFLSLLLINLFLCALLLGPIITGIDYVIFERQLVDPTYQNFRLYLIFFLTVANALTLILMFWARLSDRD
jgi:hypothetical protein